MNANTPSESYDYQPVSREARAGDFPSEEDAQKTTISGGPCPAEVKRLLLDCNGDAVRDLARSLAMSYGECWERLGFERAVYWLHRTKVFLQEGIKSASASCSSSN